MITATELYKIIPESRSWVLTHLLRVLETAHIARCDIEFRITILEEAMFNVEGSNTNYISFSHWANALALINSPLLLFSSNEDEVKFHLRRYKTGAVIKFKLNPIYF